MSNQALQAQFQFLEAMQNMQQRHLQLMSDALERNARLATCLPDLIAVQVKLAASPFSHGMQMWQAVLRALQPPTHAGGIIATPGEAPPHAAATRDERWQGAERRRTVLMPHAGPERRQALMHTSPSATQH